MIRNLAAVVALAFSVTSAGVTAAVQTPYEINVIVSQTGPGAFLGASETKMLAIFEAVTNKQGGIRGRPVKFNVYDDQTNAAVAVQLVTRFADEKVPLILGPSLVATCSAGMPITLKNGPVLWCYTPGVFPPAGGYVFATGTNIDDQILVMMRYFRERGWKRLGVIASTDASGQAYDHSVAAALLQPENKDVTVVAHEHMNPTDLSVDAQMVRIKAAKPDAVFTLATGTSWGTMMRSAADAGLDVPIGSGGGNLIVAQLEQYTSFLPKETYFAGTPAIAAGAVGSGPIKDAQTIYFKAFAQAGIKPDLAYNIAWDPTMLMIDALRSIGPAATAQQLRDYVVNLHGWAGTNGLYDFRDGAQRGVGPRAIVIDRWDNTKQIFLPASRPGGFLK
jgi:branched-chain amino acid transport system substrate-binding protein